MRSILVSLMLIILSIGMISSVNAENVPDWVKNTAGWWADDAISEMEFDDEDAWEEIILTWDFMYGDHSINDLMLGR